MGQGLGLGLVVVGLLLWIDGRLYPGSGVEMVRGLDWCWIHVMYIMYSAGCCLCPQKMRHLRVGNAGEPPHYDRPGQERTAT